MAHIHDEHMHEHSHTHENGHTHTHGGGHPHSHGADHVHSKSESSVPPTDLRQTKALLTYMIDHNEHHAEELAGLIDALPQKAQKKLTIAIGTFEAANVELREVLACLE